MSRLRNSPRLHKGAIIALDEEKPMPTVIAFQYNPLTMTRKLTPSMASTASEASEDGSKAEIQRVDRPPSEVITLTADFDATDGLERGDPIAVSMGIYPELSALEMLLYPQKSRVMENLVLAALGTIEVIPSIAPLTLFVWGPKRVLPVHITSMDIDEKAYDERLNPIQAKVTLTLKTLSYADFSASDRGGFIFMAHQAAKDAMAFAGTARSIVRFF